MELGFGQKSENRSAKSFRTRLPAKGQKIMGRQMYFYYLEWLFVYNQNKYGYM